MNNLKINTDSLIEGSILLMYIMTGTDEILSFHYAGPSSVSG
jgi:hypothetical protein